jgi:hypothetical protein
VFKVDINSYKLVLPKGCQIHHVFRCDLLSRATSYTSRRPHQAEIEGDREEYSIDCVSNVKIDDWLRRRGPYSQILTHFASFYIDEWMLFEQYDDCEQLSIFSRQRKVESFLYG